MLYYGGSEIRLHDDADVQNLTTSILTALRGGVDEPWVEFTDSRDLVHSVLVTPSIPIRIVTGQPSGLGAL